MQLLNHHFLWEGLYFFLYASDYGFGPPTCCKTRNYYCNIPLYWIYYFEITSIWEKHHNIGTGLFHCLQIMSTCDPPTNTKKAEFEFIFPWQTAKKMLQSCKLTRTIFWSSQEKKEGLGEKRQRLSPITTGRLWLCIRWFQRHAYFHPLLVKASREMFL